MDDEIYFLIIDGYIDQPGALGVPPYLAPQPRYIYGVIKQIAKGAHIDYITIDEYRIADGMEKRYDIIIIISGVSVPGKYLGGTPISYREIMGILKNELFQNSLKILCGPSLEFGIGSQGGNKMYSVEDLSGFADLIISGDVEGAIHHFLSKIMEDNNLQIEQIEKIRIPENRGLEIRNEGTRIISWRMIEEDFDSLSEWAVMGSEIIHKHPNFTISPPDSEINYPHTDFFMQSLKKPVESNLICEIETFRGCPRYITGGCSFCVEPRKGATRFRQIKHIIDEIEALYIQGVRHFRIGSQTDFYSIQNLGYEVGKDNRKKRYPKPNKDAILMLLKGIRSKCPEIRTLHIDNVNALNFIEYPEESEIITKYIVEYCTSGNVAAIGVESADLEVIRKNNLKATAEEIIKAVEVINKWGKERGPNGLPKYLPGLNFIFGLPGENEKSLERNYQLLKEILDRGLALRRINIRKLMTPKYSFSISRNKVYKNNSAKVMDFKHIKKHMNKFRSRYYYWKNKIRKEIDIPMLERILPLGTVLRDVYSEKDAKDGTYCRQVGTYPLTCYVPIRLPLKRFYYMVVVNYGIRTVVCLPIGISPDDLGFKQLTEIRGIGKNLARQILLKRPVSGDEWKKIVPHAIFDGIFKKIFEM